MYIINIIVHCNLHFTTQWTRCQVPIAYVIYRVLVAIFFVVITVLSGLWENDVKWFIFLTYWAFLLLTVHAIIEVITASYGYWRIRPNGKPGKSHTLFICASHFFLGVYICIFLAFSFVLIKIHLKQLTFYFTGEQETYGMNQCFQRVTLT